MKQLTLKPLMISTQTLKISRCCQFDGKPAIEEAFVKLVKANS